MRGASARMLLAGAAVAGLLAGCGGGGDDEGTTASATTPSTTETTTDAAESQPDQAEPDQGGAKADVSDVELYFTSGEQFRRVARDLPEGGSPVEAAAEELIEGPTAREQGFAVEAQTQIPEGTELDDVAVSGDGTAVVEVSDDFLGGIPADPKARDREQEAELNARLAQVTYTLTQFDQVDAAKVVSGGIAVEPAKKRKSFEQPAGGPPEVTKARGTSVSGARKLQQRLAELRYLPETAIDGLYGYRTQQAVMAFQAWEGLERDGVAGPITTAALADAKRPRPKAGGEAKRIEVYRSKGVALLVKDNRLKRAIHVSSGAPGYTTPAGTFEVFRKELKSWSVPYSVWLPYASYFYNGIAFHEYPDVPAYPASHGCVRVPVPEAKGVYRFAKLGRQVIVL